MSVLRVIIEYNHSGFLIVWLWLILISVSLIILIFKGFIMFCLYNWLLLILLIIFYMPLPLLIIDEESIFTVSDDVYEGKEIVYMHNWEFLKKKEEIYKNLEKEYKIPFIGLFNWPKLIIETNDEIYVILYPKIPSSLLTMWSGKTYLWRSEYKKSVSSDLVKFVIKRMKNDLFTGYNNSSCKKEIEVMELNYFLFIIWCLKNESIFDLIKLSFFDFRISLVTFVNAHFFGKESHLEDGIL